MFDIEDPKPEVSVLDNWHILPEMGRLVLSGVDKGVLTVARDITHVSVKFSGIVAYRGENPAYRLATIASHGDAVSSLTATAALGLG